MRVGIDDHDYHVVVHRGRITEARPARSGDPPAVTISGPRDAWSDGFADYGLSVTGDQIDHLWPYQAAVLRLASLVRETLGSPVPEQLGEEVDREFDDVVGRYAYVRIRGTQYRVYFEEAGEGIPIVLQHTAGSDSRQWRHLLADREFQQRFRMIAYDLPFHGRSLPPTSVRWWAQEYKMDTEHLMDSVVAISRALKLDRPVYMGCSVGGYLAPDLALYRPDDFRAVIGVNSAIAGTRHDEAGQPYVSSFSHPQSSTAYIGSRMYMITSPEAREAFRRETAWIYSQGGPGIFGGDLYYFSVDHNLIGKAHQIDTSKVGVHFLSGEYDPTAKGPGEALAAQIKGSTYDVVEGGSHFRHERRLSTVPATPQAGARRDLRQARPRVTAGGIDRYWVSGRDRVESPPPDAASSAPASGAGADVGWNWEGRSRLPELFQLRGDLIGEAELVGQRERAELSSKCPSQGSIDLARDDTRERDMPAIDNDVGRWIHSPAHVPEVWVGVDCPRHPIA